MTAVIARGVTKRFGATTALDDAGIEIAHGTTHGLVGRNGAGKSTLVSILTGLQQADSGTVTFDGSPAPPVADRDAWRRRVACVYQKSTIIPALTVAENLFLNRQPVLVRWGALRRAAGELLDRYEVAVSPAATAGDLTVEQQQLVEIARALSFGARFIILDEPTARLDAAAIARLFARMRDLRAAGVTFLFISHHLQEVYEVCETVTVFRDARHVLTAPVSSLPHDELVQAMTGTVPSAGSAARPGAAHAGAPVLEVAGLSLAGFYSEVSLEVRAGEMVGLAGSASSGKTALAETIAGLRVADAGTVAIDDRRPQPAQAPATSPLPRPADEPTAPHQTRSDREPAAPHQPRSDQEPALRQPQPDRQPAVLHQTPSDHEPALHQPKPDHQPAAPHQTRSDREPALRRLRPGSVPDALAAGLGYLPQDRHREGLVPLLSVAENATMTIAGRLGPAGTVLPSRRRDEARRMIDAFDIRTTGPDQPVSGLSGGNAQKVVLARALASDPSALVLVSPTAGVDVRSKESLLGAVAAAAADGTGVLIVSDELDDLRVCDRVLVMFHGRIVRSEPRGWDDADLVAAVEGVREAQP